MPWLFDGTTFWTYDDPQSIGVKTDYIRRHGLGGAMVWDLTGDTADGELMRAIPRDSTGDALTSRRSRGSDGERGRPLG